MDEPIFLDVNVPMYAGGAAHPLKQPCAHIMTDIVEGRLAVAIDTEIVQEILYRYGAIGRPTTGIEMARSLLILAPTIYAVEPDDVRLAVELFAEFGPKGVKARDAIHLAVMRNRGLSRILSADADFDRVPDLQRIDPADYGINAVSP